MFSLQQSLKMYDAIQERIAAYDRELLRKLAEMEREECRGQEPPKLNNPQKARTIRKRGQDPMRQALYRISGVDLTGIDAINDVPVPADYDGDGKADPAVYRGGWWYILRSSAGYFEKAFGGAANDIPVPADYDGDGQTDLAVYRGGTWIILLSSTGKELDISLGGAANDVPVPADYDGDGKADPAVYRGGWWYILRSSAGYFEKAFGGAANDIPVPADYDGDGQTVAASCWRERDRWLESSHTSCECCPRSVRHPMELRCARSHATPAHMVQA